MLKAINDNFFNDVTLIRPQTEEGVGTVLRNFPRSITQEERNSVMNCFRTGNPLKDLSFGLAAVRDAYGTVMKTK